MAVAVAIATATAGVIASPREFVCAAFAMTINVPADAPDILSAVTQSSSGDEIVLAPGVYTGDGNKNVELSVADLTFRSEGGRDQTVIDCEGTGRVFLIWSSTVRIAGLTLRNGDGNGLETVGGGAIVIGGSTVEIQDCAFNGNAAAGTGPGGGGGAIVAYQSDVRIQNCVFLENSALVGLAAGGACALWNTDFEVVQATFKNNAAAYCGGGLVASGTDPDNSVVLDCEFLGNRARGGGGCEGVNITVRSCEFRDNHAETSGGGATLVHSIAEQCTFTGNRSDDLGGGVAISGTPLVDSIVANNSGVRGGGISFGGSAFGDRLVERCLVVDNTATYGGGIFCRSRRPSTIRSTTVVRNSAPTGSGIVFSSPFEAITHSLDRTIVAFGVGGAAVECFGSTSAVAECTNLFGNEGGDWVACVAGQERGNSNLAADPLFCDAAQGDWSLCANSPCAPVNTDGCGVVGAFDVECECTNPVAKSTWGSIKARFSVDFGTAGVLLH